METIKKLLLEFRKIEIPRAARAVPRLDQILHTLNNIGKTKYSLGYRRSQLSRHFLLFA